MHPTWYGRFELRVDSSAYWQTGPFRIWAHRSGREWKVASAQGRDPLERSLLVEVPSDRREPPQGSKIRRIGFQKTPEDLVLNPVLADRPVVVSPEEPFQVPPHEKITVFISTPAWVELSLGDSTVPVLDEPTHRPTDTWFGQSPMKGELCYATRTAARINLDNVPSRPHRVISVVDINNRAKTILTVENLKIPVVHQSVFATQTGDLWTETVTLDHHEDGALANIRLGNGPPEMAAGAELVRGPRIRMEAGLLTRAFGGLLR
jgi:hypothetical protein